MNKLILAVAALLAAAPGAALAPVDLPAFKSVELSGGGSVTIRHGAQQSVTLISGDRATSNFTVDDDERLKIVACTRPCRDYDLRVEIVTPALDAIAIENGGVVRAEGPFPNQGQLAVAVSRGGVLDVLPMASTRVAAAVNRGGVIRTHARSSLVASINGGGAIAYRGEPSVTSAVRGGGTVSPLGSD